MSQQFKPRVSTLQPAQTIGGKRVPFQDQDRKYFTRKRNTLAVHKSVGKLTRSVKDFSGKCTYISKKISPFYTYSVRYHSKDIRLLQVNMLCGFVL